MTKYRYAIEKEDKGYLFILYPNNNNNQEIGRSVYYLEEKECSRALEDFKLFVRTNKISNAKSQYIRINKKNEKWFFEYIKDGKVIFYRRYGYVVKENARKIISSIYKNTIAG